MYRAYRHGGCTGGIQVYGGCTRGHTDVWGCTGVLWSVQMDGAIQMYGGDVWSIQMYRGHTDVWVVYRYVGVYRYMGVYRCMGPHRHMRGCMGV